MIKSPSTQLKEHKGLLNYIQTNPKPAYFQLEHYNEQEKWSCKRREYTVRANTMREHRQTLQILALSYASSPIVLIIHRASRNTGHIYVFARTQCVWDFDQSLSVVIV